MSSPEKKKERLQRLHLLPCHKRVSNKHGTLRDGGKFYFLKKKKINLDSPNGFSHFTDYHELLDLLQWSKL